MEYERKAHGPASAQIRLLPDFELRHEGRAVPVPNRAQRLLALLAVAGPATRAWAAARLWPDVTSSRASASLRATLWCLRDNGLQGAAFPSLLVQNDSLALDRRVALDIDIARSLATAVIEGRTGDLPRGAEQMLAVDLLPGWCDEWLDVPREQHRQLRLHALDELCVVHAEAGRYARAVDAGLSGVAGDPTRESAHRALMHAHLSEGNRMEAIRCYRSYVTFARTELGIGPSRQMGALLDRALLDGDDAAITSR